MNNDFRKADDAFRENLRLLGDPRSDPAAWNLNAGLACLTMALDAQMTELRRQLADTQDALRRLEAKSSAKR